MTRCSNCSFVPSHLQQLTICERACGLGPVAGGGKLGGAGAARPRLPENLNPRHSPGPPECASRASKSVRWLRCARSTPQRQRAGFIENILTKARRSLQKQKADNKTHQGLQDAPAGHPKARVGGALRPVKGSGKGDAPRGREAAGVAAKAWASCVECACCLRSCVCVVVASRGGQQAALKQVPTLSSCMRSS